MCAMGRRVSLCRSGCFQDFENAGLMVLLCEEEGSVACIISDIHFRSSGQQQFDERFLIIQHGAAQRGIAAEIRGIHIGSFQEEQLGDLGIQVVGCPVKRRFAVVIFDSDMCPTRQQQFYRRDIFVLNGVK